MQELSGLTHTTKVNITNQYQTIRIGMNGGRDDHTLNIQGLFLLILVKFSSQLFILGAITSKGIKS